jgi:hypothetical protein
LQLLVEDARLFELALRRLEPFVELAPERSSLLAKSSGPERPVVARTPLRVRPRRQLPQVERGWALPHRAHGLFAARWPHCLVPER